MGTSFTKDITAALKYISDNPESLDFVQAALNIAHTSRSLTRWRDLSTLMSNWKRDFGFAIVYYISKSGRSIPAKLRTQYPNAAKRLEELKSLFGTEMQDALEAYQNPLGLMTIYHRFIQPDFIQGPVLIERNDGLKIEFHFEADDIGFLAIHALEMVAGFLENKGEFEKSRLEQLKENLATCTTLLATAETHAEVATTTEK